LNYKLIQSLINRILFITLFHLTYNIDIGSLKGKTVVLINTFGWRTTIANQIVQTIKTKCPISIEINLHSINFDDPVCLGEENKTVEAQNVLKLYRHTKGKKRRNLLLAYELFSFETENMFIHERI
jgi:adenine C2-methylase RlmN of 23S rRNA A2503 and tRNA A37